MVEVKRPERVNLGLLEYRTAKGRYWDDATPFLVDEPDRYPDRLVIRFDGNALKRAHKTVSMQTACFRVNDCTYEAHVVTWKPILERREDEDETEGDDDRAQKEPRRMMLVVEAVSDD